MSEEGTNEEKRHSPGLVVAVVIFVVVFVLYPLSVGPAVWLLEQLGWPGWGEKVVGGNLEY